MVEEGEGIKQGSASSFLGAVYLFARLVSRFNNFIIYADSRGPQPDKSSSSESR